MCLYEPSLWAKHWKLTEQEQKRKKISQNKNVFSRNDSTTTRHFNNQPQKNKHMWKKLLNLIQWRKKIITQKNFFNWFAGIVILLLFFVVVCLVATWIEWSSIRKCDIKKADLYNHKIFIIIQTHTMIVSRESSINNEYLKRAEFKL